jgi:1,4-alpha-glucan branching enzyme
VGNRAFGDRLRGPAAPGCVLRDPRTGVPLVFMGEEYDEGNPFLFFADHIDPEIAAAREGRRREFERFTAFADGDVARIPARWRRSCARTPSRGRRGLSHRGVLAASCPRCALPPAGPGRDDR